MKGRPELMLTVVVFATTTAADPAEVAARHGGVHLKVSEGRSLATFGTLRGAVAAGDELAQQGAAVGLAVGDVAMIDGDPHGLSVVLAARLAGHAAPGQVLTPALVGLLGDLSVRPVGPVQLRGIPGTVDVVECAG